MQRYPTPGTANLLYLITLALVFLVGGQMQSASVAWGLLGTEFLLILLPALLYLRVAGLPARATLRLRLPGLRVAALSLLIGAGLWFVDAFIEVVATSLVGYSTPMPADFFPTTAPQAALLAVGLAVAAPLCEEVLFRGVIQRAYEPFGPRAGIVVGGLLFAFYHMRLSGLPALLPVAFALGYVAWRSDSLVSAMLVHFANNALAAAVTIYASMRPDAAAALPVGSPALAAGGALLAGACLWLLWRWTVTPAPAGHPAPATAMHWALRAVPLAGAALIYLAAGAGEVVLGRFPEVLAFQDLRLASAPWQGPARWQYEVRTVLDEPIGTADCRLTPDDNAYALDCHVQYAAFEAHLANSVFSSDAVDAQRRFLWDRADLRLLAGEVSTQAGTTRSTYAVKSQDDGLRLAVTVDGSPAGELALPRDALIADDWAWRLQALPFSTAYSGKVTLAWPLHWRPETKDSGPSTDTAAVYVAGGEPLATPAGNFVAWRVTLDKQTAWYDSRAPHTLLKYDDGIVTYVLTGQE